MGFFTFIYHLYWSRVKKSGLSLAEGQEVDAEAEESGNDFPAADSQDKFDDDNQYMSEDTQYLDDYQYT